MLWHPGLLVAEPPPGQVQQVPPSDTAPDREAEAEAVEPVESRRLLQRPLQRYLLGCLRQNSPRARPGQQKGGPGICPSPLPDANPKISN